MKQYGGTRSFTVLADVVKGKKMALIEPSDPITDVKCRTIPEAIDAQRQALKDAPQGRKGILAHRMQVLNRIKDLREKVSGVLADNVWNKVASDMESPVAPTIAGGVLGGAATHSLFPSTVTRTLRDAAAGMSRGREQRDILDKALRANASRLVRGIGMGLLGGYGLHKLMEEPNR